MSERDEMRNIFGDSRPTNYLKREGKAMSTPTTPPEEARCVGGWEHASDEPLNIIEANECPYHHHQLATQRFRRLCNEIREKDQVIAAEKERANKNFESYERVKELHTTARDELAAKDQVIERLESDLNNETFDHGHTKHCLELMTTERDALKAGQEAREMALIQYAWSHTTRPDGSFWSTAEKLLIDFNATHSGEKMK